MTRIVADIWFAFAGSLPVSIIAEVTMMMAFTLGGVRLARESSAAVRHALLTAAFGVSLTLPAVSILVPAKPLVEVPVMTSRVAASPVVPPPNDRTPAPSHVSAVSGEPSGARPSRVSPFALLLAGWATGVLLFLLPVLLGVWRMRELRRLGRPWRRGRVLVRQLAVEANLRRDVEVLLHETLAGPVSCGVLTPTIALPIDAQSWPEDCLSRAIIHELEHVRRNDWLIQIVARLVCVCYWFHPLVWVAYRRLCLEAERACDDAVLQRGIATAYADQLVGLAERMSAAPNRSVLTMANRTDLAARVAAILDSRQQRGRTRRLWLVLMCVASAGIVAAISPLRITGQVSAGTQRLTGLSMDPVGRSIPDAKVTLSSVSTPLRMERESDQSGRFLFNGIPMGEYLLRVSKFGFDGAQERIKVDAGQDLHRVIQLRIGGVEDTVEVYSNDAETPLPPRPSPLPFPSSTSESYTNQADLDRCAAASMFCRVLPPHQIADAEPVYPENLRELKAGGKVMVEGLIGRDGLIKDLRTRAPADPELVNATFEALRRWQFSGAQLDGLPIEVPIRVTADFIVP